MNLSQIMDNIYGESSSQNFDNISLTGGKRTYRSARIRYVDEPEESTSSKPSTYTGDPTSSTYPDLAFKASKIYNIMGGFSITGGAAKSNTTIYPSAEYVDDNDLKLFIKEFFLHYLVSNSHKNSIYVIPPSDVLKKMISDFKSTLKNEGINEYSPEASRYAGKTDLPFKNYIFDVYGRDSPNNEGYDYQVSSDFPDKGMESVLRRTNRLSKPYYFKFSSPDNIKVSTNDKMSNSKSLKFIAKCDNDCFILKGELPASDKGKGSNVVTAHLSGGAKRNSLRSFYKSLIRKYNDIDQASYDFISSVALAEAENTGDVKQAAKHVANMYSGDFIHSAFSILADADQFTSPDGTEYNAEDIQDMQEEIVNEYTPKSMSINLDQAKRAIKNAYNKSKGARNGYEASKLMVNDIKKMYGKYPLSMFKADLATAIVKRNSSEDSIDYTFRLMDSIDKVVDTENNGSMTGGNSDPDSDDILNTQPTISEGVSSNLTNAIYSAFSVSPFIGVNARGFTPILMNRKRRQIMKKKLSKNAFEDKEDIKDTNEPFEFQLIENNETTTVEPEEIRLVKEAKEDISDDSDNEFKAFY